jgi:predicted CopG family antitoxin
MKRLNFVVQDDVYKRLETLKERTGATSLSEVFRDALRVYAWTLDQLETGKEISAKRRAASVFPALAPIAHLTAMRNSVMGVVPDEDDLDQLRYNVENVVVSTEFLRDIDRKLGELEKLKQSNTAARRVDHAIKDGE